MAFTLQKEFIPKDGKMVPVEAIRELTRGSFEHLEVRLDDAIAENTSLYTDSDSVDVARVATFGDRVVVGTSDGKYYSSNYQDDGERITIGLPEQVDVPVVDSSNASEYVARFWMDAVNSLLSGTPEIQKENIVALMNLDESSDEDEGQDLATLVNGIIASTSPWKKAFRENISNIRSQLKKGLFESIAKSKPEIKYAPLYDGTIAEEKFHLYLEPARTDLAQLGDRLVVLEDRVEAAYLPFIEVVSKDIGSDKEQLETIKEFTVFSEGVMHEIHDLVEHIKIAVKNEQCAMCLGQIHDAIANSLTEYETAGSFVEHMAKRVSAA